MLDWFRFYRKPLIVLWLIVLTGTMFFPAAGVSAKQTDITASEDDASDLCNNPGAAASQYKESEAWKEEWRNTGFIVRGFVSILDSITQALLSLGLLDLPQLVFNKPVVESCDPPSSLAVFGTWSESQWTAIHRWMKYFTAIAFMLVAIFICLTAYRWMYQANFDPGARINAIQDMWHWIVGIVLTGGFVIFFKLLLRLNIALTQSIGNMTPTDYESFLMLLPNDGVGGIIGILIMKIVGAALLIWFNLFFLFRKFSLAVLAFLGPFLGGVMMMSRRTANIASKYWSEVTADIFIQAIYAILLGFFYQLQQGQQGDIGWLFILGYMIFMIPFANLLRSFFGAPNIGGSTGHVVAGALGLASVGGTLALLGASRGALGGGNAGGVAAGMVGRSEAEDILPAMQTVEKQTMTGGDKSIGYVDKARSMAGNFLGRTAGTVGTIGGFAIGGTSGAVIGSRALGSLGQKVGSGIGGGAAALGSLGYAKHKAGKEGIRTADVLGTNSPHLGDRGTLVGTADKAGQLLQRGLTGRDRGTLTWGAQQGAHAVANRKGMDAIQYGSINEDVKDYFEHVSPGTRFAVEQHHDATIVRQMSGDPNDKTPLVDHKGNPYSSSQGDGEIIAASAKKNSHIKPGAARIKTYEVTDKARKGSTPIGNDRYIVPDQYGDHTRLPFEIKLPNNMADNTHWKNLKS